MREEGWRDERGKEHAMDVLVLGGLASVCCWVSHRG